MAADTIFRLYSMTKPIVCTALMTLSRGRRASGWSIRWRPIIPAFGARESARRPTARSSTRSARSSSRDLMAHTSGLTYHFLEDSPVSRMYGKAKLFDAKATLKEAIDDLAQFPLAFQPGSRWHYSVGIDVAARAVEVVSGQPLGAVLARAPVRAARHGRHGLRGPRGQERSRLAAMYGRPDIALPRTTTTRARSRPGRRGVNDRLDVSATYPVDAPDTFVRGGHGLFGTIGDYFRFAQMLANGGELDGDARHRPQDAGADARQPPAAGAPAARDRRPAAARLRLRPRLAGRDRRRRDRRAGLGRRVRLVGRGQDPLLGRSRRSRWSASS